MKNWKAAGSDNIYIYIYICVCVWQKEKFAKEWKEGIIIKVPKKGDLSQCRNWRGVTLLVVISKIFNKIILERIKDVLERGLRKEQAGLRHSRSCIDQISTLGVIIAQSLEFQSPLYMLFVAYRRALDCLNRAWIWEELKVGGLPSKFINTGWRKKNACRDAMQFSASTTSKFTG